MSGALPNSRSWIWRQLHPLGMVFAGLLTTVSWAAKHDKSDVPAPPPAVRIATEPLDYHPPSSFYQMARHSFSSLDFVDAQHLLFTFRATGLLKRLAECQPDDEDQLIRALMVHLPDGKVERSAEWRLHDRGRYLWALGGGQFLIRKQDSLYLTDSTLALRPFLQSNTPLRLVKLSPDAHLLMIETDLERHSQEEHRQLWEAAKTDGTSPPSEDVKLTIVRMRDDQVMLQVRSRSVVDLPLISEGYIETLSGQGDHWMLRYKPFQGEPSFIADVASSCRPSESPLNAQMTRVDTCSDRSDDHVFQAISMQGKTLWTYRWDSHYIWPTSAAAENGTRIAFSTLRIAHPVSASDPIDETELQAQRVEVFDVATGRVELTQYATPVLSAGQNYALSPDGGQFAVLRDNAIEVYDLPPAPSEARPAE